MLARFNIFFSAVGFVFSLLVYTNAFLNPEISCVLGAKNCVALVLKSVFRNFALFLTMGFFLSFVTNFIKFFVSKEGYKIAVVTSIVVNLLTFLIAGVLMIMSITTLENSGNVNVLGVLVWAWTFVNIVISLLEMKPQVAQSHIEDQSGHNYAVAVLLFLLLGSLGSIVFSNTFIQKKNMLLLEELTTKGETTKEQFRTGDLSALLLSLDRLREDIKSTSIDYSKIETSVKNGFLGALNEMQGRRGGKEEEEKPKEFADLTVFDLDEDYFFGAKNASVTIVEFGSFT